MPVSVSKRIWKPFTKYVCISVFSPVDLALPFKETSTLETLSWQANAGVCLRTLAGFFFFDVFSPAVATGHKWSRRQVDQIFRYTASGQSSSKLAGKSCLVSELENLCDACSNDKFYTILRRVH